MLVNENGRRIDKGPSEIVSDPKRPDRAVENGLSCMSCHVRGIIAKEDQIRPHMEKNPSGFGKGEREAIAALYPTIGRGMTIMKDDAETYCAAMLARKGWTEVEGEANTTFPLGEDWQWKVLKKDIEKGDINLQLRTVSFRGAAVFVFK